VQYIYNHDIVLNRTEFQTEHFPPPTIPNAIYLQNNWYIFPTMSTPYRPKPKTPSHKSSVVVDFNSRCDQQLVRGPFISNDVKSSKLSVVVDFNSRCFLCSTAHSSDSVKLSTSVVTTVKATKRTRSTAIRRTPSNIPPKAPTPYPRTSETKASRRRHDLRVPRRESNLRSNFRHSYDDIVLAKMRIPSFHIVRLAG